MFIVVKDTEFNYYRGADVLRRIALWLVQLLPSASTKRVQKGDLCNQPYGVNMQYPCRGRYILKLICDRKPACESTKTISRENRSFPETIRHSLLRELSFSNDRGPLKGLFYSLSPQRMTRSDPNSYSYLNGETLLRNTIKRKWRVEL